MRKRHKIPEVSPKELAALTEACRMAFGNQAADDLFDEAMAVAKRLRDERFAAEQQARN